MVLGAIFQPEEDKLWLGGTARPATLNGERLTTFGAAGVSGAGRSDTPLSELGAATYIHPTWLADPMCAMPWHAAATSAAALRMFGSGSCDLSRVADGELGCWFQHSCPEWDWLPGKGDRPRGRRRGRRRAGQRTRLVRRRRHDGGPAAPCRPRIRLRGLGPGARLPASGGHAILTHCGLLAVHRGTCSLLAAGSGHMGIMSSGCGQGRACPEGADADCQRHRLDLLTPWICCLTLTPTDPSKLPRRRRRAPKRLPATG